MELCVVIKPLSEEYLRIAKQIGVDNVVDYNLNFPDEPVGYLGSLRRKLERFGLKIVGIEGSPAHDDIIFGWPGRDRQIEIYKRYIGELSRIGAKFWCYNFNPSTMRVGRTTLSAPARGNAITSAWKLGDWDDSMPVPGSPICTEQMWDNLEYFLRNMIPAAEEAGIQMAMHPDDPPISPMLGVARILVNVEDYERLFSIVNSEANGACMCVGTFGEMGVEVPATIRRFKGRINFAHLRNIRGNAQDFTEIFHDEPGWSSLVEVMEAFKEVGYIGFARADHVPVLAGEEPSNNEAGGGYTFKGRIFALGYLRGLMHGAGIGTPPKITSRQLG